MNRVSTNSIVGARNFKNPELIFMSEDQEADFTSCRLNDLPPDFAWGVATASY